MKPNLFSPHPFQVRMSIVMALSCFVTAAMTVFRYVAYHHFTYFFLVTNLFLAAVPYLIALVTYHSPFIQKRWWLLLPALMGWLLAFPNAPYIITDLMHLKQRGGAPIWFDAILLFTAAFNGLMLGLLSLDMVHEMVAKKFKPWMGWTAAGFSLAAGSFGIYLGRFLRYNSWDVLTAPKPLAKDILVRFLFPMEHPRTWVMTLTLTAVLSLFYLMFRFIRVGTVERVVRA